MMREGKKGRRISNIHVPQRKYNHLRCPVATEYSGSKMCHGSSVNFSVHFSESLVW